MMRSLLLPGILCVALMPLVGCGSPAPVAKSESDSAGAGAETKVRVTPIKPTRKSLIRYCEQPGQIAASEEAPLWAKVSGYVRQVHVDIGDQVQGPVYEEGQQKSPGQLLLSIDVPDLQQELAQKTAAVEQAAAELKQAEAAVKVARAMADAAQAAEDEASAMVERVEADVARWKAEYARLSELAARQAVTEKLFDETQSKLRAAEALLKETAAKIRSAQALHRQAEAQVEKAEADLESTAAKRSVVDAERQRAETQVAFAELRAPFRGVVTARHVDPGHLLNVGSSTGKPLLVVANVDVVRVFLDVPEVDAVLLEPGAEATIRLPALGPTPVMGRVARTTWALNQATRTLRTQIDINNSEGRLRPGMYAHARLKVAERPDVLVLPKTALMTSGGQTSCWCIEPDGTLRSQVVQTGLEAGGELEIVAGLMGEEQVISVNPGAFRAGQQVERVAPK